MKNTVRNIIGTSTVSLLAFSAVAQDVRKSNTDSPPAKTNVISNVDNGKRNEANRNNGTLLPSDQGNSKTNASKYADNGKRNEGNRKDGTMRPSDQGNSKTNATRNVDDAKRNERDRNDKSLTSSDQGTSKADVDATAKIRKEINATEKMSVSAKNVKVITKDGRVTLRGRVDSAEEKRLIGEIAIRTARSENVDNQLEVKNTTTSSN